MVRRATATVRAVRMATFEDARRISSILDEATAPEQFDAACFLNSAWGRKLRRFTFGLTPYFGLLTWTCVALADRQEETSLTFLLTAVALGFHKK